MTRLRFGDAIDRVVSDAMARDERIVLLGEDLPLLRGPLFARFGPDRVLATPISESAFLGAAVGAAMAGLRPVAELMMVDFSAVALDALLNQAAMLETFSGGDWPCPLVVRAPYGGGYGDGGQHGQALWGLFAAIPGLSVVVPSTPADAAGLMTTALASERPVVFFESKLLSDLWREAMGGDARATVTLDVPAEGAEGEVAFPVEPIPFGRAVVRRSGDALTLAGVGVGIHRALAAAQELAGEGLEAEVIDLRTLRPLDAPALIESVSRTGALLVVDEDYREFGLSGELAAVTLEAGIRPRFARVCLEGVLPYARALEEAALPNPERIASAARRLLAG